MSYVAVVDLISRFGGDELAQRADRQLPRVVTAEMLATAAQGGDLSGLDTQQQVAVAAALVVLEQAITDASSLIDGYVASRYTLPMATIPDVLKRLACEIARYNLHGDVCPDHITTRYNAAVKTLSDISTGKMSLGESASASQTLANGGAQMVIGDQRAFSRRNARGFM